VFFADLAEFFAPFFGEWRKGNANDLSVIGGGDAEARSGQGFFDFLDLARLPWLDRDEAVEILATCFRGVIVP